jgi:hypothetical protein
MDATSKVLVIKALILLLVLQDLVVQSLYSAGVFDTEYGLDKYDAEDKARRVYAFIALCECTGGIILVQKCVPILWDEELSQEEPSTHLALDLLLLLRRYFKAESLRSPILHGEGDLEESSTNFEPL